MSKNEKDVNVTSQAQGAQTKNSAQAENKTEQKSVEKKSITDLQKELAERLQELNYKKKLADNREKFLHVDASLRELQKELKSEEKTGVFETSNSRIIFQGMKNGYRNEDLFSISNVTLIFKFIEFLRSEIKVKVEEIEAEIVF
ncbi:MAG: hypothetical protein LBQ28_04605 [Prevotellaceae bacterium]|jgi:hypothetical protein|nr:hypothetical protein [Prevotellaceae bacterium]